MKGELTWIELSLGAFRKNISTIRKLVGKNILLAPCVKANAYGHGLLECAKIFAENGADWLCVDSVDEAILLRKNNIRLHMLIMGYVGPEDLPKAVKYNVRIFLYNIKDALVLSRAARQLHKSAFAHIKIDTGMHRQGVPFIEFEKFLKKVKDIPGIKIDGVATHFATSDGVSKSERIFYKTQLKRFQECVSRAKKIIKYEFLSHCANSGAVLQHPESNFTLVRPGIAVYGHYPSEGLKRECERKKIILEPALKLFTTIAQIKNLEIGECVSYGCEFTAKKKMKIAVLPVGYYDGIRRELSGRGIVSIRGKLAKIVGRVCMNIMMVDITSIPGARVGDSVLLLGQEKYNALTPESIAKTLHTIHYEIMTQLRESIAKRIVP